MMYCKIYITATGASFMFIDPNLFVIIFSHNTPQRYKKKIFTGGITFTKANELFIHIHYSSIS